MSGQLFAQALPAVTDFTSPRAWAFSLLGIHEYLQRLSGDRLAHQMRESLTARLMELFDRTAQPDWPWFEDVLSYDNAKLAHALILSGRANGQTPVFERGLQALRWLAEVQTAESGDFRPIGSNGFFPRGGARADLRSAAHRGARDGVRLPGGLPRHLGRVVVRAGPARLRLVSRLE